MQSTSKSFLQRFTSGSDVKRQRRQYCEADQPLLQDRYAIQNTNPVAVVKYKNRSPGEHAFSRASVFAFLALQQSEYRSPRCVRPLNYLCE
jgi:hypothetical protein